MQTFKLAQTNPPQQQGSESSPCSPLISYPREACLDLTLQSQSGVASWRVVGDKGGVLLIIMWGRMHVRGGNLFSLSILNSTHSTALRGRKKATLWSSYAKSAECSICKPGLAVQTKHDYISHLHVLPCPPFPIFPGEKIMWLGCVILLKLHTPDSALLQYCVFAYRLCCVRASGHLWVCLPLTGASAVKGWPSVAADL